MAAAGFIDDAVHYKANPRLPPQTFVPAFFVHPIWRREFPGQERIRVKYCYCMYNIIFYLVETNGDKCGFIQK
jgi:hypothetical protein